MAFKKRKTAKRGGYGNSGFSGRPAGRVRGASYSGKSAGRRGGGQTVRVVVEHTVAQPNGAGSPVQHALSGLKQSVGAKRARF